MQTSPEKITGAEFAARLLGVAAPQRSLDSLLEALQSPTGNTWESNLLELKASYHPSIKHPDPDANQPEAFEWNVVHAFINEHWKTLWNPSSVTSRQS